MRTFGLALLGAALSLVAAAAAPDWTRTAVRTPEGGIRVGNPRAAKRFVEVANYTCGHCAHFAEASGATLAREIRAGRLAMEVRPFVNNAVGLSETIAARCVPARFFAVNDALFRAQNDWVPTAARYLESVGPTGQGSPAVLRQIAERGGIAAIATANGVGAPQLAACYASKPQRDAILKASAAAGAQIEGTPAFRVGAGQSYQTLDWTGLAAQLGIDTNQ